MSERSLIPVEQKEIEFYSDKLSAVQADDGHIYASIPYICQQLLGTVAQVQRQRINRHTVLSRGLMVYKLHTIDMPF